MKARIYERITELEPDRWDAVHGAGPPDPFSSHAALAALEAAQLEGVRMWYATLEDGAGRWVAAAPLTRVEIDGRRLSHGLLRRMIAGGRRLHPGFMRTAAMVCGAPLSVGNPPARMRGAVDRAVLLRELAGLLGEAAQHQQAPWRGFKEFPDHALAEARSALEPSGWILVPSEPNFRIPLPWSAYDGYLGSLRSDYRYKIRKAAHKMQRAGVVVDVLPLREGYEPRVHRLYDAVMDRATIQLEYLTPAFFIAFGRAFGDAASFIRLRREGRVVGWVAMLFADGIAFDMFHGIDYAENPSADLYFNQLAEVIRLAIVRGARVLSMGQSTEIAKTRFGGRVVPLWAAMCHRNYAVQAAFRAARQRLFPRKTVPVRRVFRDGQAPAPAAD